VHQVETIRKDAHEKLKLGTKKTDLNRFFDEHNIPLTIVGSEAYGAIRASGCALGCGRPARIDISVELDAAGAVTQEAIVDGYYTDCM